MGEAFVGAGQFVEQSPQCVGSILVDASQPLAALPSQSAKSALHVNPQALPSHVGVALGGDGQGAHEVLPQVIRLVFETHAPPHAWYPTRQAKPHSVPSHVATALAGATHGVHDEPQ